MNKKKKIKELEDCLYLWKKEIFLFSKDIDELADSSGVRPNAHDSLHDIPIKLRQLIW